MSVRTLDKALPSLIERLLVALDAIGLSDPDQPVNGAECVDVLTRFLPAMREAIAAPRRAPRFDVEGVCAYLNADLTLHQVRTAAGGAYQVDPGKLQAAIAAAGGRRGRPA